MGSEIELFQVLLLLVTQPPLMCCGVICSTSLNITSVNTSVHWGSVLSAPCPPSGLWCRDTGAFLLQPQARLKLQRWPSTGSRMAMVRDAAAAARGWPVRTWENVLVGTLSTGTKFLILLFFVQVLIMVFLSVMFEVFLEWRKVFKKGHWTLWRVKPAPLGILPWLPGACHM